MRDQRAERLAQILVRYSTRVAKGDTCVIQSTTTAEPLVQAGYGEHNMPDGEFFTGPHEDGVDDSAVHWDIVCDLRQGGSITVDGEELQRDGRFVV